MGTGDPFGAAASSMIQLCILQFDKPSRVIRQLRTLSLAQAQAIFLVFPSANNINVIHTKSPFLLLVKAPAEAGRPPSLTWVELVHVTDCFATLRSARSPLRTRLKIQAIFRPALTVNQ
jgi:hypothetical protein